MEDLHRFSYAKIFQIHLRNARPTLKPEVALELATRLEKALRTQYRDPATYMHHGKTVTGLLNPADPTYNKIAVSMYIRKTHNPLSILLLLPKPWLPV